MAGEDILDDGDPRLDEGGPPWKEDPGDGNPTVEQEGAEWKVGSMAAAMLVTGSPEKSDAKLRRSEGHLGREE